MSRRQESPRRVIGVDPGTHNTGWGVVEAEGSRLTHIASGTIRARGNTLAERLRVIADTLDSVVSEYRPRAMSVETLFYAKNVQSALKLGHGRGVALLAAARGGLPVFEYTAGQIKRATTRRGRAEKTQVQLMVRLVLGVTEPLGLDASDALAAAICHLQWAEHPSLRPQQ